MNDSPRKPFLLGVNYWPARSAMYWWRNFDKSVLDPDFARIQETGMHLVRLSLLWEDFQPQGKKVATACLDNLVDVAEMADRHGLRILPTFFAGHICGLNWLPPWALWAKEGTRPFGVFSQDKVRNCLPRNFYEDPEILEAQAFLIREVSGALAGHPAVWAWDLGNEVSNVVSPPDREAGGLWLRVMTEELRNRDETIPITLGMRAEDLWEGNVLRPVDAAPYLDFISMQGVPFRCGFAGGPMDTGIYPFLGIVTQWLSGKHVFWGAFGLPTGAEPHSRQKEHGPRSPFLASEEDGYSFYSSALDRLWEAGMTGAMVWGFSDYAPLLWNYPPMKENVEERSFGIFRHDGNPKHFQPIFRDYSALEQRPPSGSLPGWIDLSPEEYYERPGDQIQRLYRNYVESC